MAKYVIETQWESGEVATGRRVVVAGTGILDGMTDAIFTNSSGVAVVEIDAVPARIYVDGNDHGLARPGRFVVTIR